MNIAAMDEWFYNEEAGRYWLKECIGHGGSGSVFRAHEILQKLPDRPPSVGAEAAVKILQPDPTKPELFQTLQLAASLTHHNILRCEPPGIVRKFGTDFYYLPMEMAAESLRDVLAHGPLTVEKTVELAGSLASALDYTHTLPHRIVHRDLKPGNILRVRSVWKLCDFGIARVLEGPGGQMTETTSGTEGYLPPERLLARRETRVDTPYDIWSMGIVLLEALGRLTPGAGIEMAMRAAVLKQDPNLPSDLPAPLGEVVRGCLRFDATHRLPARAIGGYCSRTQSPAGPILPSGAGPANLTGPAGADAVPAQLIHLAERGDAAAQCRLGWMYDTGNGMAQSDTEAVNWYRRAADRGNAYAQCSLGVMFENGRGVGQNYAEAVRWYRQSAGQGNAYAQNNLGLLLRNGRGAAQDDVEAVIWFRKAAEQALADAQCNLGWMYRNGRGVARSDTEAIDWIGRAAAQGDARAQILLRIYATVRKS